MPKNHVYLLRSGGTISMVANESDTLIVSEDAQDSILQVTKGIPRVKIEVVPTGISKDSSDLTYAEKISIVDKGLEYLVTDCRGVMAETGTDTQNQILQIAALRGVEITTKPFVIYGSIREPGKGSDAVPNAVTATMFTRFGNYSGTFAIRPDENEAEGHVIHRTDVGGWNWHNRKPTTGSAYATIDLSKLIDDSDRLLKPILTRTKDLRALITYNKIHRDGALDTMDTRAFGVRGKVPSIPILGFKRERISATQPPQDTTEQIKQIVNGGIDSNIVTGLPLSYLVLSENLKRNERADKQPGLWRDVMLNLLEGITNKEFRSSFMDFWERFSGLRNEYMDFSNFLSLSVTSDPSTLLEYFGFKSPNWVVLKATGAAGARVSDVESYLPLLQYCREHEIPAVLTSDSGEPTGIRYGPSRRLFDTDSVFFAGTMDEHMIIPRMALLQSRRQLISDLVDTVSGDAALKKYLRRNVERQLISGTHYSANGNDRSLARDTYKLETRIDLLGGLSAEKAVAAAFLHTLFMRDINPGKDAARVLSQYENPKSNYTDPSVLL